MLRWRVLSRFEQTRGVGSRNRHHLSARRQPGRQSWRKIRGENAVLGVLQFIRDAAVGNYAGIGVVKCERGAPVPITGLPNRPRIDHVAKVAPDRQLHGLALPHRFILRIQPVRFFRSALFEREAALQMRVTKKCDAGSEVSKGAIASCGVTTYSSSSSGEPCTNWASATPSMEMGPCGRARSHSRLSGVSCSRVHVAATDAMGLKSRISINPQTALS